MKTILSILASLFLVEGNILAGDEHVAESHSPLLTIPGAGEKGSWIPGTYGGVTGVVLDLDQVGTDKMLSVLFRNSKELRQFEGAGYKIHSDKTVDLENGKGRERRVLLVHDEGQQFKNVICYTIKRQHKTLTENGEIATPESTFYTLSMTRIKDEFEVIYLHRLYAIFPNEQFPKLTKPPKREQAVDGNPH